MAIEKLISLPNNKTNPVINIHAILVRSVPKEPRLLLMAFFFNKTRLYLGRVR